MLCPTPSKTHLRSQGEATRKLLVVLSRDKAWERPKQPIRVYECPCGNGWAMTSKGRTAESPVSAIDARIKLWELDNAQKG